MSEEQEQQESGEDEFAGIEPARPVRRPLVAAAVVGLASILLVHSAADLRYWWSGSSPSDLGDARTLAARGGALRDNVYVTVSGQPDRRNALTIEPRGETTRQTFFRLLGTDSRLWVRTRDARGRTDLADRFTGRLRRFEALPYADQLRRYHAEHTTAIQFLALDDLRAALAQGRWRVKDRAGADIDLAAAREVLVDVAYPEQLRVSLSKDVYPGEPDARHELERMGFQVGAGGETPDAYEFALAAPHEQLGAILAKLEAKQIAFQPRSERVTTHLGELRPAGDQVQVPRLGAVPWSSVKAIGLPAPIRIPPEAFVLTEGDAPADHAWLVGLAVLLLACLGFNAWYLVRALRRR
jgi:hypothetical protein